MMGAMKAKLLPRQMGTFPLLTRWKINVPIPAVNRAVDGSKPTNKGSSTVAPKATKRNCTPTIPFRMGESVVSVRFVGYVSIKDSNSVKLR